MAQASGRLRDGLAGVLPRRGRGIAILFHFFAQGGRRLILRVPLAAPRPDGLRTAPVHVLLQPDGDVLVTLPREELESGRLDARSAGRLAAQLHALAGRTATANPLWGLDAFQVTVELGALAAGLSGAGALLRDGLSELTSPAALAHAAGTAVLLALPFVLAKLRPWLVRTVLPRLLPLAMRIGERLA